MEMILTEAEQESAQGLLDNRNGGKDSASPCSSRAGPAGPLSPLSLAGQAQHGIKA